MSVLQKEHYELLEQEFVKFKSLQAAQKQRGLNDFNVFTTLLSKSDEVRLHSRFIAALLDVSGKHYQGSLFLELFLSRFKPAGFEFDAENSSCYREYNNIDIYLTDGSNHIIVENKIHAADQEKQVQRYIESILYENPDLEENRVWFCYLTPKRSQPRGYSLGDKASGGFELVDNRTRLRSNTATAFYSNIHYKKEIPEWLQCCLNEVSNLKDLSLAIEQYQSVVAKVNGTYKSKVMNLEEYLNTLSDVRRAEFLSTLISASKALDSLKQTMMDDFFENLQGRIEQQRLPDGWNVEIVGGAQRLNKKHSFPFRISNAENNLLIGLEFRKDEYVDVRIGVVRKSPSFDIKKFVTSLDSEDRARLSKYPPVTLWWLYWKDETGSLWERVVEEGEESVLQEIESEMMRQLKEFEWVCNESARYTDTG